MTIYPAIDIKDGKCVRLRQGAFAGVTVYNENPAAQAVIWQESGARYIHAVDLDGARYGRGYNDSAIARVIDAVSVPVQIGGGIRTMEDIETKLSMGAARVILGTAAVLDTALLESAAARFGPDRIVVGIDEKNGFAAVSGWENTSGRTALEICLHIKKLGLNTVIYTDISKDGMMQGPNTESTARLLNGTGMDIIASGGVSSLEDLERLQKIGVSGVIVGKALFTGTVNLREAVALFD